MNLKEIVKAYNNLIETYWNIEFGKRFGEIIVEAVRDVIPDIKYDFDHFDAGPERVCFFAESHEADNIGLDNIKALFDDVIEDFISKELGIELHFSIDCPYGIGLTAEEAEEIRRRLRKLIEEG